MESWDTLKSWTKSTGLKFLELADASLDTPLIGNWCYSRLVDVYVYFMNLYMAEIEIGRWLDSASTSLGQILSWDSIRANIRCTWSWLDAPADSIWSWIKPRILGSWSWIDTPADSIWSWVKPRILGSWSWLDAPADSIWSWVKPRILGSWSWIDTIDDRIRNTARAQWSWIDTIDDRIKGVAWDHVASKLGDWLLSWLLLNLTIWGRLGYQILDKVWNMEWDDARKEVK